MPGGNKPYTGCRNTHFSSSCCCLTISWRLQLIRAAMFLLASPALRNLGYGFSFKDGLILSW